MSCFSKQETYFAVGMKRLSLHRYIFLLLGLSCLLQPLQGQPAFLPPSDQYRPDRLRRVVLAETALFALTSIGLYALWYKKFPRSRFHLHNDNNEWLQIDKIGHTTTAYTLAAMHHDLMRWSGVKPGAAIATGALSSLAYLSIIEVMDGFSRDWGFSKGDMLANISGAALFAAQQYAWGEQRMGLKISARFTPFAAYNPDLLGKNWASRLMKDYNGQTYWLSINLRSFLPANKNVPVWSNLALGYGADGMIGARNNPTVIKGNAIPSFERSRQWYLAADADLFRIPAVPAVQSPLYLLQFMKVPAPAIEFSSKRKLTLRPINY